MRVKFIVPVTALNPEYSKADKNAAEEKGEKYTVPKTVEQPAGFEIDDPHAWIHCVPGDFNAPARAVPVDDEARAKVNAHMKKRAGNIERVREILKRAPRNKEEKEAQKALREAYANELGLAEETETDTDES